MSNTPAVITNLISNLEVASKATPQSDGGDFMYLKMTKAGEWCYGADETEVASDSAFVIDPNTYAQGYVAWDDGELVDEKMATAGQPPIAMSDLPALAAGVKWDSQVAFGLKGIDSTEEGIQMLYKVSSRGGKQAVADILAKIIERGRNGESAVCPIVYLDNSSYKHKKYGKIYTPILAVDEWIDLPSPEEAEPVAKKAEPKKEPVAITKQEPEPEPVKETEPVAEKPKRKRRTRASA
jgi:hypothetical protein